MLKRERFQRIIEARTRWTLILVVVILALLVVLFLEFYYAAGGVLTGKQVLGGSGSSAPGGTDGGIEESQDPTPSPSGGGSGPYCGDYHTDDGEQCDDGSSGSDQCTGNCQLTYCGDGLNQSPNGQATQYSNDTTTGFYESCDDGNTQNNDACIIDLNRNYLCEDAYCGDGYTWNTECGNPFDPNNTCEECDDGNNIDTDVCRNDCTINPNPRLDNDQDGIFNDEDNCPSTPNGPLLGTCFNPLIGDISVTCEPDLWRCPRSPVGCYNNQSDTDGDGIGDVCDTGNTPDPDNDGNSGSTGSNDDSGSSSGSSNTPPNTNDGTGNDGRGQEVTEYSIAGGENFNRGQFAQIIVSLNDRLSLNLEGESYAINIFGITNDIVSLEIITPYEETSLIINTLEIKRIVLGENEIAIKVDEALGDYGLAYLTIASLGKKDTLEEPLEQVFEQIIAQEENTVTTESRKIQLPTSLSPQKVKTIVYASIIISALIIITIIYYLTKPKEPVRNRRKTKAPRNKTRRK